MIVKVLKAVFLTTITSPFAKPPLAAVHFNSDGRVETSVKANVFLSKVLLEKT